MSFNHFPHLPIFFYYLISNIRIIGLGKIGDKTESLSRYLHSTLKNGKFYYHDQDKPQ
jgi:hypothetical protein